MAGSVSGLASCGIFKVQLLPTVGSVYHERQRKDVKHSINNKFERNEELKESGEQELSQE